MSEEKSTTPNSEGLRKPLRIPGPCLLALGICLGMAGMHLFTRQTVSPISVTGVITTDTMTYADQELSSPIYIVDPTAPRGKLFLKFSDQTLRNEARTNAMNQNAEVIGVAKSKALQRGGVVTEIQVQKIRIIE